MKCGTTFWLHGNLKADGKPFGSHEMLNRLANNREPQDDDLPCEMFKVIGHRTFCAIERYAGNEYKPIVCREFPEIEDECFFGKVKYL